MTSGEASLLLDGTNMESLTECVEGPVTWPYQGWTQRGDFPTYPGIDGAEFVSQPYDTAVLPVQVTLRSPACSGGSGQAMRDALRDLRAACRPDRVVTLRRLWPDTAYEDATAKFLNITPARPVKNLMSCLVEFTLLGLWYGPSLTLSPGAGTHIIPGDVRTRRITLTLAAGAARTITNTTNGFYVTYTGTVPTGGVTIDVEAKTATAITGGADKSASLRWGKLFPMQLEPGSNVLTVTAGTFTVAYQPAYL